ncbi:helix-turn-helix domain-containing protein [Halobacillus rhizosphaerae]|uniref:AraC family transcriptional regulator n=1 Tax=Halobacillus rhizosphaerae TaxID=3064889 RepID=UPI00398B367F
MDLFRPIQSPSLLHVPDSKYSYKEHQPSQRLRTYTACYWTLDYHPGSQIIPHRILPDGCLDIIFDLTASTPEKGAFVTGLMTQFEVVNFSSRQHFLGIRFFSTHAQRFIKYPPEELLGYPVSLENVWGKDALSFFQEIQEAEGTEERINKIETKLMDMINNTDIHSSSKLLEQSIQHIYSANGMSSVQLLAKNLIQSERNLRRIFNQELGVSPKEFSRIIRFQSLLKDLHDSRSADFMETALKYGYYDQAHFNHDFKSFYGLVPSAVFPSKK